MAFVYKAKIAAAAAANRAPTPPTVFGAAPGNSAGLEEVAEGALGKVGLPAVGAGTVPL